MITPTWHTYTTVIGSREHSVIGNLKLLPQLYSPQLHNCRDLLVYLPPSYTTSKRRYPVIYMHDGQNLFDQVISYAGEWQVDETMETLSGEGREAIVVGVPNAGTERINEYSPFRSPRQGGGKGDAYLAFLVETIKPLIDRDFRTLPDRAHTGVIGSSMGGLISLYAFFRCPDLFGFVGALSPAFWFSGDAIIPYVVEQPYLPGKIYLDVGTLESGWSTGRHRTPHSRSKRITSSVRRMHRLLLEKGYLPEQTIRYIEEREGVHNEAAWAARLPAALRFLLPEDM